MRATLHEELMREAGFEVERDFDRAERRRDLRRRAIRLLRLAAGVGALIAWVEWAIGIVSIAQGRLPAFHGHYFVAFVLVGVGLVAGTAASWLTRDEPRRDPPSSAALRAANRMLGRELVDFVVSVWRRIPRRQEA